VVLLIALLIVLFLLFGRNLLSGDADKAAPDVAVEVAPKE